MEEDRLVSCESGLEDIDETSLRPRKFNEYIGQAKVKENLNIFIEAAKRGRKRSTMVLLYGPPGLGKTTLAGIIALRAGRQPQDNIGSGD